MSSQNVERSTQDRSFSPAPAAPPEVPAGEEPVPYDSPLEHLRDHISRLAVFAAAHLARLPERFRGRRSRHPLFRKVSTVEPVELGPEELGRLAAGFSDDVVPAETEALWHAADDKLVAITGREAATFARHRRQRGEADEACPGEPLCWRLTPARAKGTSSTSCSRFPAGS